MTLNVGGIIKKVSFQVFQEKNIVLRSKNCLTLLNVLDKSNNVTKEIFLLHFATLK